MKLLLEALPRVAVAARSAMLRVALAAKSAMLRIVLAARSALLRVAMAARQRAPVLLLLHRGCTEFGLLGGFRFRNATHVHPLHSGQASLGISPLRHRGKHRRNVCLLLDFGPRPGGGCSRGDHDQAVDPQLWAAQCMAQCLPCARDRVAPFRDMQLDLSPACHGFTWLFGHRASRRVSEVSHSVRRAARSSRIQGHVISALASFPQ